MFSPRSRRLSSRRQFLIGAAAATGVAIAPWKRSAMAQTPTSTLRKPPRLQPGDAVGIISPARPAFEQEDVAIVMEAMRGLGLVPRLGAHVYDRYGYLAGQDRDRAADINTFFADPTIKALIPIQGGWGTSRLLPYLDYALIAQNPKIVVGFSDITALLLAIAAQSKVITFHGPNGLASWRSEETELFRRVLFDGETVTLDAARSGVDGDRLMQVEGRIQTITPGVAQGRLVGGNLSVLSGIAGSPYVPNLEGAILFLEDVGEYIYRVDRMITQLKLAGLFDQLSGFIFGQCSRCGPDPDFGSLTLEEVVRDHIAPLGIPAWMGARIGHIEPVITLPIGSRVEIDASTGRLQMLEAAVQ
jgi:muramoyltetrapeptide carboxypeptidase